jgi:hypothetical protein
MSACQELLDEVKNDQFRPLAISFCIQEQNYNYEGINFQNIPYIQEPLLANLLVSPKNQFLLCFQQYQKCWIHCVNSEGDVTSCFTNCCRIGFKCELWAVFHALLL